MIDWDVVAPMITGIVLFLTVGGVILLRPISKHLGAYLEALTRREMDGPGDVELRQLRDSLERLHDRFELLEERQQFTERLLESRSREDTSGS